MQNPSPFIVGIGGTIRPGSSSERALAVALEAAQTQGARTRLFGGTLLARLPHFSPGAPLQDEAVDLVEAVRDCDGVIIASPGYHGSISGLVKNALDTLESLSREPRPYLDGRAVGLISTVDGWQAAGTTLAALRAVVHALRGWPTPMGVALNGAASGGLFDDAGGLKNPKDAAQLGMLAEQVLRFARAMNAGGEPR